MSTNDRLYNYTDAAMIQHAETVNVSLTEDIADFTSFDSTVTETYPTSITSTLTEIKAIKSDQVVIDEMAALTEATTQKMQECSKSYNVIAYFARKVFASSPAVQNQFGLNDYKKINRNQPKMVLFMYSLASTAASYATELVAAGCNQSEIDKLPTLASELKDADTAQEKFKKDRNLITQNRVIKLNELYKSMVQLSDIAQIIYVDNQAKLAKYLLS